MTGQSANPVPEHWACSGPAQSATWSLWIPLGTWVTQTEVDWDWGILFPLSIICLQSDLGQLRFSLLAFSWRPLRWATSLVLVLSTEVIGSKSIHGMSPVLEIILGGNPVGKLPSQVQLTFGKEKCLKLNGPLISGHSWNPRINQLIKYLISKHWGSLD